MKKEVNVLGYKLGLEITQNKPMEYKYQQLNRSTGYAWNAMQRIEQEVGLKPTAMGDSGGFTFVNFSRELTAQEKTALDALMASNPLLPPTTGGTKFVIRDVWNQKALIETQMGFPYKVFYSSSQGNDVIDQVELHFDQNLTTPQRNRIISEYAKLITLK